MSSAPYAQENVFFKDCCINLILNFKKRKSRGRVPKGYGSFLAYSWGWGLGGKKFITKHLLCLSQWSYKAIYDKAI